MPKKLALICFHKNLSLYDKRWINKYRDSILEQTYKDFDIFEINYGGTNDRIFNNSTFSNEIFNYHSDAHNFLLDKVFNSGYDWCLNSNIDDFYNLDRIKKQSEYFDSEYDIISCNYIHVDENDEIIGEVLLSSFEFEIEHSLKTGHNIIAHPAVMYSKNFWLSKDKLKSNEIPRDDLNLWIRLLDKGYKFKIIPESLMYYRSHSNKIS